MHRLSATSGIRAVRGIGTLLNVTAGLYAHTKKRVHSHGEKVCRIEDATYVQEKRYQASKNYI